MEEEKYKIVECAGGIVKNDKNQIALIKMDNVNIPIYSTEVKVLNPKLWGYKLGTYIGGNNPAPKIIELKMRHTK